MNLIKKIGILSLCGLLTLRVMIAPIVYLDYEFNKEFIIKNYCVNKDRPQLHCDGKCYLAKKLKAAQEKEEQQGLQNFVKKLLTEVFDSVIAFKFDVLSKAFIKEHKNYLYLPSPYPSPNFSIIQPPD